MYDKFNKIYILGVFFSIKNIKSYIRYPDVVQNVFLGV